MRLRCGLFILVFLLGPLLAACQGAARTAIPYPTATLGAGSNSFPTATINAAVPTPTADFSATFTETAGENPPATTATLDSGLPASLNLDPADWKNWPVLPTVTERARMIYQIGQGLGNDPHAFSVFGDCQSEPDVFMGPYETDPQAVQGLTVPLMETVVWFTGSFNRKSPTVRGGTTTGALLWATWHQNKYTCSTYESPISCELRIHKPAFVIIHVGTHYETRNEDYMRKILDQLIAAGVVPILASKADDRELDDRVNAGYARLAVEYNIPFWNFWAAVDGLPNRGLYTREDAVYQGDLYLTDAAVKIHRLSALQMLDIVRRAVEGP